MRARAGPGLASLKVSNAFRFVFGPSRWVSEASTISVRTRWRSMPSPPTSANPAPKMTANLALAAATSSNAATASPTRMTARSTGPPGTSWMVGTHTRPSSSTRLGFTGVTVAPKASAQARNLRHMLVAGRPAESEAPITATDSGSEEGVEVDFAQAGRTTGQVGGAGVARGGSGHGGDNT